MLKTLKDLDLKDKNVFIRVDFNLPMKDGKVTDDTRVKNTMKTINYVLEQGGKPALITHVGRPKGKRDQNYSVKPIVDYINEKGFLKAVFVDDCIGDKVKKALNEQKPDTVLMLENVRFYSEEESNDLEFSKKLAEPFDCYVNDAFGTCHRKHSSVYGVPILMSQRAAGFLVEKEALYFNRLMHDPDRPFAAILGGAKVSEKIGIIESLLDKADVILIGGAMAYTFLSHAGHTVGNSLVEPDQFDTVKRIIEKAKVKNVQLIFPVDHLISAEFNGLPVLCESIDIPGNMLGLDIGPKSIELFNNVLAGCKTVLWNGPVGVFENPDYANGTFAIAKLLSTLSAMTVVGGGDSVAAVNESGVAHKISYISTGGGASLEYIEYGSLPGVEVLGV